MGWKFQGAIKHPAERAGWRNSEFRIQEPAKQKKNHSLGSYSEFWLLTPEYDRLFRSLQLVYLGLDRPGIWSIRSKRERLLKILQRLFAVLKIVFEHDT